ncbi:hypothetical protein [Streptomyces sp. CBMA152]|uniref:hypothetical protein n=1 Tax=Streptomyces sp. CBMA152 TaxID=1896312 RepID=UPI001660C52E|nr:hypothetical protein [Streptomyces sp. CBMA152]MBD0746886.1 hypothetical protein [Streptomyces sp. CBMA152]
MISTRRIATVLALAAGVSGLGVSAASAAPIGGIKPIDASPISMLDGLTAASVPADQRSKMPTVKAQLSQLNKLNDLNQLHQLTDLVAPVTGLVPAVE